MLNTRENAKGVIKGYRVRLNFFHICVHGQISRYVLVFMSFITPFSLILQITVHIELVNDDTNEITFKKVVTSYYHGQMSANKVIGMEPNTDYWVTVEMFNSAGLSNPSERQRLSTCLAGKSA